MKFLSGLNFKTIVAILVMGLSVFVFAGCGSQTGEYAGDAGNIGNTGNTGNTGSGVVDANKSDLIVTGQIVAPTK